jgi:RNA polymerase sigma-70 factor (ECF subfamily)
MSETLALAGAVPGGLAAMMGTFVTKTQRPVMSELPAESSFDLLLLAKQGSDEALERLWSRYLPRLRRWAHGRLPASARGLLETEDLAQEVLTKAFHHVGTFEPRHEGAFQGYIRQILLNRVRDEVRKGHRRPEAAPLEDDHHQALDPSPLEMAIGRQAMDRYEAAMERLKPQDRQMIVARLELGFTASEIAAEFGKPTAAAAQMAVSRALVRLAEEMARV